MARYDKRLGCELTKLLDDLTAVGGEARRESFCELDVWGGNEAKEKAEEIAEYLGIDLNFHLEENGR